MGCQNMPRLLLVTAPLQSSNAPSMARQARSTIGEFPRIDSSPRMKAIACH
jgi:hypothetical protein